MKKADKCTVDLDFNQSLAPKESRWSRSWLIFRQNRMAMAGLIIFVMFFITALSGLFLTSGISPVFDPSLIRLQEKLRPPLSRPNAATLSYNEFPTLGIYLFGTDDLGRDIFSRMLEGAWVSLTVGFVAVGLSVIIGIFMGGIAGYYGQNNAKLDTLIMRFVDIMLCFPSFFLILTVVALLPASMYNIMIVIGLTSWMGTTRLVRAEFLSLREQDFVTAARALGIGNLRIIFRHMMPNAIAPVLVSATIGIASAIMTEAGLSFLGFGVPPPHATWGNILSDGKNYIFDAPWITFIPGTAILIVVLSFNLFGEGLRDILNPKLRGR
ncbi:Dipeptide transport system permease protein DppC [uncultured Desulfobacterium sp.]|uniref:Dipeptide transport system permease protein DppC n=1 Tax=uncultured Desulfobacterium sp. TaxID=201089 RepID=A0A445N3U4_9BACT|nr:Dipeptide transport system permease protein DppC [uncultured Desulfobacterium sp.]